jgi:hypothetical protein
MHRSFFRREMESKLCFSTGTGEYSPSISGENKGLGRACHSVGRGIETIERAFIPNEG